MIERGVIDLSESDLCIVQRILDQHVTGRAVYVFGSRATGKARRRSDLDLAVGGGLTMSLEGDLRDAFDESDLSIEVDVVDLATVSETFRRRIKAEWLPLSSEAHHESEQNLVAG